MSKKMSKKAILPLIALLAAFTLPAMAETTIIRETTVVDAPPPPVLVPGHTTTTYTTTVRPGIRPVYVEEFDANLDRLLTMNEVGAMLFRMYDTDGNMVIDNVEYERPSVLTVVPMGTTTRISYDFDNDGLSDRTVYSYDSFMKYTTLARFDRNGNGLSPHEFAGMSFLEADVDNSRAIEMKEWQGTYIASIDKKNRAEGALNK